MGKKRRFGNGSDGQVHRKTGMNDHIWLQVSIMFEKWD